MNLIKKLTTLKPEHQLLLGIALIVILCSLFWRTGGNPFSIGASAHLGSLKGSVELEAFEGGDQHDDNYIYRNKAFVLFHVPWCGYCKNVMPIWDQLAQQYSDKGMNIMKVDCEKFTDMATKHQIDSYPTIRYYPNGMNSTDDYITYIDTRDLSSFQNFIRKHSEVPRMHEAIGNAPETFKNANTYSAPVGYNDYELFEPFGVEQDADEEPKDRHYLKYMAGGKPGIPLSFSN